MSSSVAVPTKGLGSLHEVSRIGGIHPVADPMPGVAYVVAIGAIPHTAVHILIQDVLRWCR